MHPNNLPPHVKAVISEARNAPASVIVLKLIEGFLPAARAISAAKIIAVPDSPFAKRIDDLDRALTVFMENHMRPIAEEVERNPDVLIKDA